MCFQTWLWGVVQWITSAGKHLRKKKIHLRQGAGFELEWQNFIFYYVLLLVSLDYRRTYLQYYPRILKALINPHLQKTETQVSVIVGFKRLSWRELNWRQEGNLCQDCILHAEKADVSGCGFIIVVSIKLERRYIAGFQIDFFFFRFLKNNVRVKTFQRDNVLNQIKPA